MDLENHMVDDELWYEHDYDYDDDPYRPDYVDEYDRLED